MGRKSYLSWLWNISGYAKKSKKRKESSNRESYSDSGKESFQVCAWEGSKREGGMNYFEKLRKQIEERLNKGEDAESIINESKSEVERRIKAIVIAQIALQKLAGMIWGKTFQKLHRFFNQTIGIDQQVADKISSILFYVLDSVSLAKLLNFVDRQERKGRK